MAIDQIASSSSENFDSADSGSETSEELDPLVTCRICIDDIEIFAVGVCNHVTCFKCIVRLRYKMNNLNCPYCREELKDVFLSKTAKEYGEFSKRSSNYNKRYQVYLPKSESSEIMEHLRDLTSWKCRDCPDMSFSHYNQWTLHQSREHKLFPCDLCTEKEALFPSEIKLYDRSGRARHKNEEHPICEFCDVKFYNKDELYRHLRKQHEYCRLCERETHGGNLEFFDTMKQLRRHFKDDHHYCTHPDCNQDPKIYSVFLTDLELDYHMKQDHGDSNTRKKKISQQITGVSLSKRNNHRNQEISDEEPPPPQNNEYNYNNEQFPSLDGSAAPSAVNIPEKYTNKSLSNQLTSEENFPSLGGKKSVTPAVPIAVPSNNMAKQLAKGGPVSRAKTKARPVHIQKQAAFKDPPKVKTNDFPVLGNGNNLLKPQSQQGQSMVKSLQKEPPKKVQNKPNLNKSDFPTLGGGKTSGQSQPASSRPLNQIAKTPAIAGFNQPVKVKKGKKRNSGQEKKTSAPPVVKKVETRDDDWWDETPDNYMKGKKLYAQNIGRQGGSGLINGQHPLAAKIAEPVVEVNQSQEKYTKSAGDFPSLGRAPKTQAVWKTQPSSAPQKVPEKKVEQPNLNDNNSFPGLGGFPGLGINNNKMSNLARNFKTTSKPAPPSTWASTSIKTKKTKK